MSQPTPEGRQWVSLKWQQIRAAQQKADVANNDWSRINAEINDLMDRQGITDIVQRAQIKGASLPMKDALATGEWHSRNAERHIHDVTLYLKLKESGYL